MTKRWPAALLLCLGLLARDLSAAPESWQIPGPDGEPVPVAGLFVAVDPSAAKRSVSGRVFDSGGTPLVEVWISIRSETPDSGATVHGTRSLEDGSFFLSPIPQGPATLTVAASGYESVERRIEPSSGGVRLVAVLAREDSKTCGAPACGEAIPGRGGYFPGEGEATVHGWVTGWGDAEWGSVRAVSSAGVELPRSTIKKDGSYQLWDLDPGTWAVIVETNRRILERTVDLKGGEEATVSFNFTVPPRVSGRVLDAKGKPARNAEVWFSRPSDREILIETDEDGFFSAHLTGGRYRVWASRRSSGPSASGPSDAGPSDAGPSAVVPLILEGPGVAGLELRLTPPVEVSGRVHGLRPHEIASPVWMERSGGFGVIWGDEVVKDNRFHVPNVGPGEWVLSAQCSQRVVSIPLIIPPGSPSVSADITCLYGDQTLQGTLIGSEGEKESLWIAARRLDAPGFQAVTRERGGSFLLEDLLPGRYLVSAGAVGDFRKVETTVEVPGGPVVLDFRLRKLVVEPEPAQEDP